MNETKRTILIIGNGPSTKLLANAGFDKIPEHMDTLGTTNAFRYFERINWWPTYYVMADKKVAYYHRNKISELIHNPKVSTKRFFAAYPVTESDRLEVIDHMCTGTFSLRKCLEMGYDEHLLIGMEGAYVEKLPESRALTESEFDELGFGSLNLSANLKLLRIITKTPNHNPNYFFDDYQQEGDIYSLPRAQAHQNNWKKLIDEAANHKAKIYNLSPISKIEEFEKRDIYEVFAFLDRNDNSILLNLPSIGPYASHLKAQLNESIVVSQLFANTLDGKTMLNIGINSEEILLPFKKPGWSVFTFPLNAKRNDNDKIKYIKNNDDKPSGVDSLTAPSVSKKKNETILSRSMPREVDENSFSSAEDDRISLIRFLEGKSIKILDFLRVDANQDDINVLEEFPWDAIRPTIIEFRLDEKTNISGVWSFHKIAKFLSNLGYKVYVSEWYPINNDVSSSDWKQLILYPCLLNIDKPQGKIIAVREEIKESVLIDAIKRQLRLYENFITYKGNVIAEKDIYTIHPTSRANWLASIYRGVFEVEDQIFCTLSLSASSACTLSIKLCRDGKTPFESSNKKTTINAGDHTIELTHQLKHKPDGIRVQLGTEDNVVSISNLRADIMIRRNGKTIEIRGHRPELDLESISEQRTAIDDDASWLRRFWSYIRHYLSKAYRGLVELFLPANTRRRMWAARFKYNIAKMLEKD